MVLTWPLTRCSQAVSCSRRTCGKYQSAGFRAHLCGCWRAPGLRLQCLIVWTFPLGYAQHRQNSKAKTAKERPRKWSPKARSRISRLIKEISRSWNINISQQASQCGTWIGLHERQGALPGSAGGHHPEEEESAGTPGRGECVGCRWSTCLGGIIQPRRESLDQRALKCSSNLRLLIALGFALYLCLVECVFLRCATRSLKISKDILICIIFKEIGEASIWIWHQWGLN